MAAAWCHTWEIKKVGRWLSFEVLKYMRFYRNFRSIAARNAKFIFRRRRYQPLESNYLKTWPCVSMWDVSRQAGRVHLLGFCHMLSSSSIHCHRFSHQSWQAYQLAPKQMGGKSDIPDWLRTLSSVVLTQSLRLITVVEISNSDE